MADNGVQDITVLLTGGTGTFGSYLIRALLAHSNVKLILLVRASSHEAARARVEEHITLPKSVEVYRTDLTHDFLSLTEDEYKDLAGRVTHILHAAASTRFISHIDDLRIQNVTTTRKILEFASDCTNLERFMHMSSAAVSGRRTGIVLEDELGHTAGFNNAYEQSKYEAEQLVRKSVTPWVIARPPLVYSKPLPGYKGPTNSLAHGLRMAEKGYLPLFPGAPESRFDIVDGEETARISATLLLKPALSHQTYHITNGDRALTVGEIVTMLRIKWQSTVSVEYCGDIQNFKRRVFWKTLLRPKMRVVYNKAQAYLSWFAFSKVFDNKNLCDELGISHLEPEPAQVVAHLIE